jgi:hypothetical protein
MQLSWCTGHHRCMLSRSRDGAWPPTFGDLSGCAQIQNSPSNCGGGDTEPSAWGRKWTVGKHTVYGPICPNGRFWRNFGYWLARVVPGLPAPAQPPSAPAYLGRYMLVRTAGSEVAAVALAALLASTVSSAALLDSSLGKTGTLRRLARGAVPHPWLAVVAPYRRILRGRRHEAFRRANGRCPESSSATLLVDLRFG